MQVTSIASRFARALGLVSVLASTNSALAPAQQTEADTAMVLFRAALRADAAGESGLAESLLRFVLNQYPGTAAADQASEKLRSMLQQGQDHSGRVELTVWGAIYGGWLGLAVPRALSTEDLTLYGLGLLIGSPTGLLGARAFARSGAMSLGQARAIRWGSIWGTWQGIGWREALELGTRIERSCNPYASPPCYEYEYTPEEAPVTAAIVGGFTGITVASALARSLKIDVSTTTAVELASLWGTWFGLSSGVALGLEDDALITATLLAGNAALIWSALGAPKLGWSVGRYRLVSAAGLAGALAGLGINLLFEVQDGDKQVGFLILLASSATGLGIGVVATRKEDGLSNSTGKEGQPLLHLGGGGLKMGFPALIPTLLPAGHDGVRLRRAPGVYLKLAELSPLW